LALTGNAMPQTIDDLDLVAHTCMVPDSEEHIWETAAAWVAGGLRAGERVLYFEDDTADLLLGRLEDDRIPVDGPLADGQFAVVPTEATRAMVATPLDQIEPAVQQAINESAEQGWPAVRLIGEIARGRIGIGLDVLVGFETIIERVLRDNPTARALCLYDKRVFDDEAVAAIREIHRTELVGAPAYDDGQLRVTRPEPGTLRLAGEIDRSTGVVLRRILEEAVDETLRSATGPDAVTLNLASLRFLDVARTIELIQTARQFPAGHRLVLTGVRPRVRRVFERCGAGAVEQLVLEPRWSPAVRGGDA
jgi:anti-anti-sigma regulatory factor